MTGNTILSAEDWAEDFLVSYNEEAEKNQVSRLSIAEYYTVQKFTQWALTHYEVKMK